MSERQQTKTVPDADLPGSILDPEVFDERAARIENQGEDSGADPLELVFHHFRHETL